MACSIRRLSRFIEAHRNRSIEGDGCYLVMQRNSDDDEVDECEGGAAFSLRGVENFEELCELHFEDCPYNEYKLIAAAGGIVCIGYLVVVPGLHVNCIYGIQPPER